MRAGSFDVKERASVLSSSTSSGFSSISSKEWEIFKALLGHYNHDNYPINLKTIAERNNTHKILERNGLDNKLLEDLRDYKQIDRLAHCIPYLIYSFAKHPGSEQMSDKLIAGRVESDHEDYIAA
jgi:hypothetical protein